ncbi:hypothetical protein CC80DRAFT_478831 [Byssothecium circinans]|uniref:Globin-sensor domain-containing protein n=1 Tax=Byssothecium circinans TaxID=147558 RepID=A0A6A5TK63_9PLEO|nr:hypothetical protein CC80DRAFT_478831 [Byssothecium circinans]
MRHVERRELYENLSARLDYLQQFLEFGPADVKILKANQSFIKKLIPSVSEIPFRKILKQDITAQALITRSTKNEADLDEEDYYGPDSKNMKNRAMFVRWYLTKLNSDPSTPQYWEYMNMVGAMHNGHHRRAPLHIDVIHFAMLLGYLQNTLNDAIINSMEVPLEEKAPLVKSWGKLFWIQNDLFTKWHVSDGGQYDQQSTKATKLSKEPILSCMKDERGNVVQCPFSGMAKIKEVDVGEGKKLAYSYTTDEPTGLDRNSESGSLKSPTDPNMVGIGSIQSIAAQYT